ncbi:hypothetical protein NL50_17310 [Clostridium acetobutylicum]|nr:hypothetical protein NL50_17310 [Clostridium acetobutylicum]
MNKRAKMFGRKYNYFVVYKAGVGKDTAIGNAEATREKKIKNKEDIKQLQEQLRTENNFDWCAVINFILL